MVKGALQKLQLGKWKAYVSYLKSYSFIIEKLSFISVNNK